MEEVLLIAVTTYPILLFLWKLRTAPKVTDPEAYFLASKNLPSSAFIDSSVAYGYQIAAISLFATWGYSYGFWSIWVPVFWAAGFFLLRSLLRRGYLAPFLDQSSTFTLHGFLASSYKVKSLGKIAALISIFGLSGTAFFEAEFTGSIVASAAGRPDMSIFVFVAFVTVALVYIALGGFRTVVATDRLQLTFGFVAFSAVTAVTFARIVKAGYVSTGLLLSLLSLAATSYLVLMFSRLRGINPLSFKSRWSPALVLSALCHLVGFLVCLFSSRDIAAVDSIGMALEEQQFANVFSLGGLSLVSLLVANGLWQVVDISNWQRLSSLDSSSAKDKELDKSLTFVGVYSAVTWALAIFFGMALRHVGPEVQNAWTALQDLALSLFAGDIGDLFFGLLLIFAMISIMFSTLDSLISSLSFTAYKDLGPVGESDARDPLRRARYWTIFYVLIFLVAYKAVRVYVSGVDDILYTFYAFQLALFPVVIGALLGWRKNRLAAFCSVLCGSALCLLPLLKIWPSLTPYNSAALLSVGGGLVVYLAASTVRRFNVSS